MIRPLNLLCLLATLVPVLGCRDVAAPETAVGKVQVVYDGEPVVDVQVRLHAIEGGPVVAQAVTDGQGMAPFMECPSPEPDAYFVSLESVSDGSWMLDPDVVQRAAAAWKLQPFATQPEQTLKLPPRSIQVLEIAHRRS